LFQSVRWTDILIAGATLLTAIGTFWYVWLTRQLWKSALDNLRLTRQSHEASIRPWIAVAHCHLKLAELQGNPWYYIELALSNSGHSPATVFECTIKWKEFSGNWEERIAEPRQLAVVPGSIVHSKAFLYHSERKPLSNTIFHVALKYRYPGWEKDSGHSSDFQSIYTFNYIEGHDFHRIEQQME